MQVKEQKLFLEKCQELWVEFEVSYSQCCKWLEKAEKLVSMATYGYSFEDTEAYLLEIKVQRSYKQTWFSW